MAYIDEATDFTLKLATGSGIPEALSNVVAYGYCEGDLYDALIDCEWDAEAFADVLNDNADMLYSHNWQAVRTMPRILVAEGVDGYGNRDVLRVILSDNEPDMIDGFTLKISLTNRKRVSLALSNIVASEYSNEDFKDYLYDAAATEWSAESFADAANQARHDGVIYDRDWTAGYTREDKCSIKGRDAFGNEHVLIIRMV